MGAPERRTEPEVRAGIGGRHPVGRVDDDHGAARVVADPVRHVAQQELLASGHAGVARRRGRRSGLPPRRSRSPWRGRCRSRRVRGRGRRPSRSASASSASEAAAALRVRSAAPNSVSDRVRRARSPGPGAARRRTVPRSRSPTPTREGRGLREVGADHDALDRPGADLDRLRHGRIMTVLGRRRKGCAPERAGWWQHPRARPTGTVGHFGRYPCHPAGVAQG